MEETNWMDLLKPGDKVIVRSGMGRGDSLHDGDSLRVVERCLPTQVIIATQHGQRRFSKKDGYPIGEDKFNASFLVPWTIEAHNEILRLRALNHLWRQFKSIEWKQVERLNKLECSELKKMLDDYRLSEIWRREASDLQQ